MNSGQIEFDIGGECCLCGGLDRATQHAGEFNEPADEVLFYWIGVVSDEGNVGEGVSVDPMGHVTLGVALTLTLKT